MKHLNKLSKEELIKMLIQSDINLNFCINEIQHLESTLKYALDHLLKRTKKHVKATDYINKLKIGLIQFYLKMKENMQQI